MNFQKMTKKQLEAHGRKNGVELDRRKSKKDMIAELNKVSKPVAKPTTPAKKAPAKKPVAKKAPAKKPVAKKAPAKKPVAKKAPAKKPVAKPTTPTYVAPKLSFFDKVKKFFNL